MATHDDVIKWKHFPRCWSLVRGFPRWFPRQRPVTRIFDVFFDLLLHKRLGKQSWHWWFETPSRPLWHQYNANVKFHVRNVCCLSPVNYWYVKLIQTRLKSTWISWKSISVDIYLIHWSWLLIQYIPRNMHTVFALLCFVVVIHWLIFPYPSGLLH